MVVSSATTSTTNITGLRTIARGSSLRTVSPSAGTRMAGSSMAAAELRCLVEISIGVS